MKINIRGPIISDGDKWLYKWLGMPATSPEDVRAGLEEASGEDIELDIASNGGLVTSAVEIYQALRNYKGRISARIAYACSAATVIACGADESEISEVGFFMIHNAQSYAAGDKQVMAHEKDVLDVIDNGIISAYEKKTGMSRSDIQELMNKDTYLSAEEAVNLGFVDGLIPDTKASAEEITQRAVASAEGMIPPDAVKNLSIILKMVEKNTGKNLEDLSGMSYEDVLNGQISGEVAGSDNNPWKGEKAMGLQEIMAENPEISNEIEEMTAAARAEGREEGIAQERERMNSLDAIAGRVSAEALHNAKYVEPMDGPSLAFKAMQEDAVRGTQYMAAAKEDSEESGGDDVGVGDIDAGEENEDDKVAEAMANHVNQRKEGR